MEKEVLHAVVKNAAREALAAKNSRVGYEWESGGVDINAIKSNIARLKDDIKHMMDVMQKGKFTTDADRKDFEKRLREKNTKLAALEDMEKKARK